MSKEFSRRDFFKFGAVTLAGLALPHFESVHLKTPEYDRLDLREIAPDVNARAKTVEGKVVILGIKPDRRGSGGTLGRLTYSSNNLTEFTPLKRITDRNEAIYHPLNSQEVALALGSTLTSIRADGTEISVDIGEEIAFLDSLGSSIVVQGGWRDTSLFSTLWTVNKDTGRQNLLYEPSFGSPDRVFTAQKGGFIGFNLRTGMQPPRGRIDIAVWTPEGNQMPGICLSGFGVAAVGGDQEVISYQKRQIDSRGPFLGAIKWNVADWEEVVKIALTNAESLDEKLIGTGIINNSLAFFTVRQAYQSRIFSYHLYSRSPEGNYSATALTPEMTGPSDIGEVSQYAQVLQPPGKNPIVSGVFVGSSGYEKNLLVPRSFQLFVPFWTK